MSFLSDIIIIYFVLIIFVFLFSNRVIFQKPASSYHDSDSIIKLQTIDGALISAIYLANAQADYVILISHGNATDIGYSAPLFRKFQQEGYSVFAYDYRGYGTSEGVPTEKRVYADIDAAYHYLTETLHISPHRIILYGQSLGAAVSIDLASRKPVAAVIAQAPFITAFRVITIIPLFPFDKFNNLKKIHKIQCPILVIHGIKDSVIPFWQGQRIYKKAQTPKDHYWVDGADHNDLFFIAGEKYWTTLKDFIAQLESHP